MSDAEVERCARKLAARLYKKTWEELTEEQRLGLMLAIREIEAIVYGAKL